MKHFFILFCLLTGHFFAFGQDKSLLLEGQFNTAADVNVTASVNGSKTPGLSEESKKAAEGILIQRELPTGIKILTLKEGRGKALSPLVLSVPLEYATQLELLKGDLTLTGITGDIEAATQAGNLKIKQLNARVRLHTGKGDIEAAESTLTGDLITQSGNILLTDIDGPCVPMTKNGTVSVRFSEAFLAKKQKETFEYGLPFGTIEAVGALGRVKFQTGQGSIRLQKAPFGAEALIARKGDIQLEDIGGNIRAVTASGSVFAQLLPQVPTEAETIWLEAQQGDVTLIVPKELTGFLTLDVAQTEELEKNYVIESSIDLGKPQLEEITTEKGEKLAKVYQRRHSIGGKEAVGEKQPLREIVIRVRNGNVFIKSL
ncbi:DUF4097 family beta strand repeat-containing protein [Runella slithyformis]|nr:DUF4097 family beta strand repeat-containing protein [Runella slithyformis]